MPLLNVPRKNDKILILNYPWLGMVLSGEKTLEIRSKPFSAGRYWLGHKKLIYAEVKFGQPRFIATENEFDSLRYQHLVKGSKMYEKTFGLPVLSCKPLKKTIPFHHPRGAVSIVKYRK